MARRDNLMAASDKAQAAVTGIITARAFEGRDPGRQQALLIEAEAALYAAIDLIWETSPAANDRFVRMAGSVAAAPFSQSEIAA